MPRHQAARIASSSLLALVLASCANAKRIDENARPESQGTESVPAVVVQAPASDPAEVLDRFLDLSLFSTRQTLGMFDSVWTCPPDVHPIEFQWLAAYHVLSTHMLGDTAVVAAEVVTAAHQTQSAEDYYGWIVTRRVQRDTLHWNLIPSRDGQGWMVCGPSREDVFFDWSGTPEHIVFRPEGTTWETMAALVDSVQRAETGESR